MPFQKYLDQFLESWLPTRWSQGIMGVTILLSLGVLIQPDFLIRLGFHQTVEQIQLIRQILPLMILFLGTFLTLLLVINHHKNITPTKNKPSLTPYFNLLWDTLGNIYCPKCEIMLADAQTNEQITHYINRSSFQCPECKQTFLLKDVHGDFLSKNEAFYLKNKGLKSKFNHFGTPHYIRQVNNV